MTGDPSVVPAPRTDTPAVATLPGLRTLRSARFRLVLAACLWLIGTIVLGMALARQAADPQGQFGIDFGDYHAAAQRLAAGGSPYAPEMLRGPVDAQGVDRYRYPPPLAQALIPLAAFPVREAAFVWLGVQAICVYAAVWLASGLGGARRSGERLLWSGVAATWFLPVFDTLWKGNVSGILALQVTLLAAGGALAGLGVATATLLKVVPVVLSLPVLGGGRRGFAVGVAAALVIGGISFLLAPKAWVDYAVVLPNLLSGSADQATNLAPAGLARTLGAGESVATLVRLAALVLAAGCAVASLSLARRPGGWHAAVGLATAAMLLLPAALWFHYLCVLLPVAALVWTRASARDRTFLLAGAAAVVGGVAWLPAAAIGTALMLATAIGSAWPAPVASPAPPSDGGGIRFE